MIGRHPKGKDAVPLPVWWAERAHRATDHCVATGPGSGPLRPQAGTMSIPAGTPEEPARLYLSPEILAEIRQRSEADDRSLSSWIRRGVNTSRAVC